MIKVNKFGFACLVAFAAVLIAAYDAAATSASSCYPRDIVMMVDESASSNTEFKQIQALCKSIVKNFDVGARADDDRFALYSYTDSIKKKFPFGTLNNKGKLTAKIGKLSRVNTESSSLPFAVDYALKILDDQGRSSSQKVIIIVADGVLDIPSNPSTSVYDVCDNIADASELTSRSLQSCLENLVKDAVANDVVVIHVPTNNIDDADNVFTSSDILSLYVKEATSSSDAAAESCVKTLIESPTDTAPTESPTPAPTLLSDTSCYVSNKQFAHVTKVADIENPIKKVQTAAECGSLCYATELCEYFTLTPEYKCFLYETAGSLKQTKSNFISGPKYCLYSLEESTETPTANPTKLRTEDSTFRKFEAYATASSGRLNKLKLDNEIDAPTTHSKHARTSPTTAPTVPPTFYPVTLTQLGVELHDAARSLSIPYTLNLTFIFNESPSHYAWILIRGDDDIFQPELGISPDNYLRAASRSSLDDDLVMCTSEEPLITGETYEAVVVVTEGYLELFLNGTRSCHKDQGNPKNSKGVKSTTPVYVNKSRFVTIQNVKWSRAYHNGLNRLTAV